MKRSGSLSAALLTLATSALAAQPTADRDAPRGASTAGASSPGRPIAGALLGGAAGALAGGLVGIYVGGNRCHDAANPDTCHGVAGMLAGTAVGLTLGAPVGAHLLNRRQGALGWSLLASATLAAAGVVAFQAADERARGPRRGAMLLTVAIAVPVLQVASAAIIEQRTGRQ